MDQINDRTQLLINLGKLIENPIENIAQPSLQTFKIINGNIWPEEIPIDKIISIGVKPTSFTGTSNVIPLVLTGKEEDSNIYTGTGLIIPNITIGDGYVYSGELLYTPSTNTYSIKVLQLTTGAGKTTTVSTKNCEIIFTYLS